MTLEASSHYASFVETELGCKGAFLCTARSSVKTKSMGLRERPQKASA